MDFQGFNNGLSGIKEYKGLSGIQEYKNFQGFKNTRTFRDSITRGF